MAHDGPKVAPRRPHDPPQMAQEGLKMSPDSFRMALKFNNNNNIVAFCSSRMLPEFDFKIPALTDHRLLSGGWRNLTSNFPH